VKANVITIKGVSLPALGFGTYDLYGKECERAIESALEIGYRHIDAAPFYRNEDHVGIGIKNSGLNREELFITTKVWPDDFAEDKFFKSVEKSLKDLQLDCVDLLLLHWPRDNDTNIKATEYLLTCYNNGLAKQIGVSNFNMAQLKQAQKQAPIFCNQIKYHPYLNENEMLAYMQEQDLLFTAYSLLGEGSLKKDKTMEELGKKYDKTPVQIALRWLVQQPNVSAIPKAIGPGHQKENIDIFDFELSGEDIDRLR
jgi:2,5-diketo-D-gluconate reductase B